MLVAHHHDPEPKGATIIFLVGCSLPDVIDHAPVNARSLRPRRLTSRLLHFGAEQLENLLLFKNAQAVLGLTGFANRLVGGFAPSVGGLLFKIALAAIFAVIV